MLSQEDAHACLREAAAELEKLSYEELEGYAATHGMFSSWQTREVQVQGETILVHTMLVRVGRLRKRISVEVSLGAEGRELRMNTPSEYFERFKSGRFYPSPREEAREDALIKSLPYVLIGVVLIGLLSLVWHLFLRPG